MPRNYKRKRDRADIDERVMKSALNECLKNKMKVSEAARQYGVKRTTLQSRIKSLLKKKPLGELLNEDSGNESSGGEEFSSKYTVKQVFTVEQEGQLRDYIKKCSNLHYGLSYVQIRKIAYQFAKSCLCSRIPPNWDINQLAGKDWLQGFMKRNNDLSLRKPESTSLSRSMAFNKPVVDDFFMKYTSVLEKFHFTAERIWNLDETGITTVVKPVKIVSTKGKKQVGQIASAERGTLVTFIGIVSAIGTSLPPVYIYPRIRNPADYLSDGSPTGSIALGNKSGWMTAELFPDVLKHIVTYTNCSSEHKILLLVDNHESHLSVEAIRFCKANGIVLLSFPPHTTHRMQPLDVGIYGPFKTYIATAFNDWMLAHPGQAITIRNISSLSNKAYENAFSMKNIKNAFQKTGLWPLDRLAFTEADFIGSSVTDRPISDQINEASTILIRQDASSSSISDRPVNETNDVAPTTPKGACIKSNSSEDDNRHLYFEPIASTSKSCQITIDNKCQKPSFEMLFPYPKVDITKKRVARRKSKCSIYTDTPELKIREDIELNKKRRQTEVTKKGTKKNVFKRKSKPSVKKMVSSSSSESDISLNEVNSDSGDDLEDFEPITSDEFKVGMFVLIQFPGKAAVIHYIGCIQKIHPTSLLIKFLRRKGNSHNFVYPDVEDVSEVDFADVLAKLEAPSQTGTARCASIFTFNYNFSSLTVK